MPPTAASPAATVPVIVCVAWLVSPPLLVIATVGAMVSSVKVSARAAGVAGGSVSLATMLWAPSPDSVRWSTSSRRCRPSPSRCRGDAVVVEIDGVADRGLASGHRAGDGLRRLVGR